MAVVTRFVNTASSSGGDGTTNNTTGATRAYVSLSAAEAAEQTNLVTDGDNIIFLCTGSSADTTATTFAGWTTGSANDIVVKPNTADESTTGIYDTGKYRLETSGTYENNIAMSSGGQWLTVQGIQSSVTGANSHCIHVVGSSGQGSKTFIVYCILHGDSDST